MKLILSILLFSVTTMAQIIAPSNIRTYKQFRNYILNPDAEYNVTTGVTDASGIVTRNTTAPINGVAQFSIDSTSSGQTVKFRLNTLPEKFAANSGEATFRYYNEPGTATGDYKWYVENASGTKVSPERSITTSGSYPVEMPPMIFTPGTTLNQPYYLVFESIVANATAMFVDDIYAGDVTSIGQFASISEWQNYTPTFTGFGTVTCADCMQWRKVGSDLEIRGRFVAGTTTATEARISYPNNLISVSSNSIPAIQPAGEFKRSAASSNTMTVLIESSVGYMTFSSNTVGTNPLTKANGSSVLGNGETGALFMKVPIAGWSASQSAAAANQTDVGWTAFTPTIGGLGTVTSSSAFWRRQGETLHVRGYLVTGTVAASLASITLPNGLSIDTTKISVANTSGLAGEALGKWTIAGSNLIGNMVSATGTSSTLVYFSGNNSAGTTLTPANGNGCCTSTSATSYSFSVPISGWAENQRAPTLIGSVTSNSVSAMHTEWARITAAGVVSELGGANWINGNCSVATSTFTCDFVSGTFSGLPVCSILATSGSADYAYGTTAAGMTATQIIYAFTRPGVGNIAADHMLTCTGPR